MKIRNARRRNLPMRRVDKKLEDHGSEPFGLRGCVILLTLIQHHLR